MTQKELAFVQEHPLLRVQNERNWAPFNFRENASAKGYGVDYIKLLATKAGFRLKFIPGHTWSSYLKMLHEKQLDVITSMKITPQRENYALFVQEPTAKLFHAILQREGSEFKTLSDLEGKSVSIVKGYFQEQLIKEHFPKITIVYAKDEIEAMRLVAEKKVDASINYYCVFAYNIKKHSFVTLYSIALEHEEYFPSTKQYIGIRNDWEPLKVILDKAQQSMSEKELHQLRAMWLNELQDKNTRLTQNERDYIKEKKIIRFCSDLNWMPFEKIENGQYIGINSDFLERISQQFGLTFKAVETHSWQEGLEFIKTNRCDFLSTPIHMHQHEDFLNFSSVYLSTALVVTTRSSAFYMHSLQSINSEKIGIVKDYAFEQVLRKDNPNINLVYVENAYEGMKAVDEGKIYAYIDTLESSFYQLRTNSFSGLKISGELEEKIKLSFAVKKDDNILFDILEKGLNSISKKERKEIYDRWVYTVVERIDYSLIRNIIIAFILILLLFAYRYKLTLNYTNKLKEVNKELEKLNLQLETLAQTDQLTKISNRRFLDLTLEHGIKHALRYKTALSIILIDIDFFKNVNDTYGHQKGDDVLVSFANIIKENTRELDTVGRWGGEEFLIILPQTNLKQATILAEKLRQSIRSHSFGTKEQLTASFGVTEFRKTSDEEHTILSRVDANLYKAKENGRDQTIAS